MTAPLLIAQISDLHIKEPGQLAYRRVDTAAALKACIEAVNRFRPQPALVVISGDLADTPTPAEYVHLRRLLEPLAIPYVITAGNHDDRAMMREAFPDQAFASHGGPLDQIRQVGELDVILLDSSVPGSPHGALEADTLAWLRNTLAGGGGRPALIFLHHPPFHAGIWHMDRQNLRDADSLAEIVRAHPRVRIVAAGHVHRSTFTRFAGVPATICPAPNHAVDLDLGHLREPSFIVEPPAFHVHAWLTKDSSDIVTHLVPIGHFDGPHPFFGPDGKLL